ncbi:N-Dimethylarginine dimethylaminohydrolase [Klenkia marina]|uniref:N-Dimethylarginine dimethylaminohydrolase n=1 Tax=Klenkia marina TaxID=1960309 RepID=A0A1G4XH73_9ACTN|nr:dimethylargininase [Klenkia marina]SCX40465.1 N-Dimethylarginine dimethylaminohydrolase [Klenkia marina]
MTVLQPAPEVVRTARTRHYVMCPPTHFEVVSVLNPWMDPAVPVDRDLAMGQWSGLVAAYQGLGHRVELLPPVAGLPDMVFAANGATVVGGRALGARFTHPERRPEAAEHRRLLAELGVEVHEPVHTNEGEGDFAVVGDLVLAGTGFRTDRAAHAEAQELFGLPVVSLQLVDPRFYHLDTCLAVLDDTTVAWFPGAFSTGSQQVLRTLFPDAVEASEADALAFGLNAVSDGRHVVLPATATGLAADLRAAGFEPVPVELDELVKAGGSVKCCTQELRGLR